MHLAQSLGVTEHSTHCPYCHYELVWQGKKEHWNGSQGTCILIWSLPPMSGWLRAIAVALLGLSCTICTIRVGDHMMSLGPSRADLPSFPIASIHPSQIS